jgi:hypothetical protein
MAAATKLRMVAEISRIGKICFMCRTPKGTMRGWMDPEISIPDLS